MIHICDLICKEMSHEKVNSGFIYGLRLAFPNEKIIVYADKSHTDALASILKVDSIEIGNIDYVPVSLGNQNRLLYYPRCYFVLKSILKNVLMSSDNKVFFLSFNNVILHIIKKLKCNVLFVDFKFSLVLHGSFEAILETEHTPNVLSAPVSKLIKRLKRYPLSLWPQKVLWLVSRKMLGMYQNKVAALYAKFFTLRELLLLNNSLDYKYIALSSHIIENARNHIDTEQLNIHLVTMPTVFSKSCPVERNNYPKFGVFGYGNTLILHHVLTGLTKLKLDDPYEIRNIGSNNAGIGDFPNVTLTSSGSRLTRSEMEAHARDIDFFLILHPADTYRLSCSASIFEALSYEKPIIHFDNSCINTYNTEEIPIGFCVKSIDQFVDSIAHIIKNHATLVSDSGRFKENISRLRERYSIEHSKSDIEMSFTWSDENMK
jgi:hypothetical protein